MMADLGDLNAFLAVVRAKGYRGAARATGMSASSLSESVRWLEERLGVRLLHRTTRSVTPTETGTGLMDRLVPALAEVEAALNTMEGFRDGPAGTLRLNVPVAAARIVLPRILPDFLVRYPNIQVEIVAEDNIVDVLAAGSDAGIRYNEHLEQDMIAVPIGSRVQRFALAASPSYLVQRRHPAHPRDLLEHACLLGRFRSGALMSPWELECRGETVSIEPRGPLVVSVGGAMDLAVDMAIAGAGIVGLFEDWLQPHFASGALVPVLPDWWSSFPGPFLYYSGRRLVPTPLRAFLDHLKNEARAPG
jgi:DNA-binding transcriptional LysR family regulator